MDRRITINIYLILSYIYLHYYISVIIFRILKFIDDNVKVLLIFSLIFNNEAWVIKNARYSKRKPQEHFNFLIISIEVYVTGEDGQLPAGLSGCPSVYWIICQRV